MSPIEQPQDKDDEEDIYKEDSIGELKENKQGLDLVKKSKSTNHEKQDLDVMIKQAQDIHL